MAGLQKVQVVAAPAAPFTTGPCYIWLAVPKASRLKIAAAQNATRGTQRIIIFLCGSSLVDKRAPLGRVAPAFDYIPLNDDSIQGGKGDWVRFSGDLEIRPEFNTLVASFDMVVAADVLRLAAGYE